MLTQVVIATNALAVDEGLRRGFNSMLGFEGFRFIMSSEPVILDRKSLALQQVERFQSERANTLIHGHPITKKGLAEKSWRMNDARAICASRIAVLVPLVAALIETYWFGEGADRYACFAAFVFPRYNFTMFYSGLCLPNFGAIL